MEFRDNEMSLPTAAQALGCSWNEAYRLLLRGELAGRLGTNGRWLVNRASVERLVLTRGSSMLMKEAD